MGGKKQDGTSGSAESRDEIRARETLRALCRPDGEASCPRCGHRRLYSLAGERFRCAACRYTFREFSGRWLDNVSVSCVQWLELVRLFAEECSPEEAAQSVGLSPNTVFKAYTTLRFAVLAHAHDGPQLLGPETRLDSYLKGSRLLGGPAHMDMGSIPVFGVMDGGDWALVDMVPGLWAETLFHFHLHFHLPLRRVGHLVYSARYKAYDALLLCGNDSLPYGCLRRTVDGLHVERPGAAFWTFAMERLRRYRGVSCQRFPLYLKELEFRYNNRDRDLRPQLLSFVCGLVLPPAAHGLPVD